ncbi:MAG: DUF2207 domain-containing protein [Pseudomonadota bacterium]|nr:DUF2207 domain-containing protein [Pseudomonadota bacterium]
MKALLLLLALLLPAVTRAEERILSYDSAVDIRADGSLDVVERIRVRAEGNDIRHGIYRDFPTRYRDRHGNRVVVGFEVIDVQRDGKAEPWFTETVANGVRINTGDDDLLPVPAETTYTLRYRTTRQVGFFATHDELYWNAIGHGWRFPIDRGSVELRLPGPVPTSELTAEGYSGAFGAQGQDFDTALPAPGVARWQLQRPLQPQEGLTVVLSFPKGVVAEPSPQQRMAWLLKDNRGVLIALAGLIALLLFCLLRWRQVGRDPSAGTIIVRYQPPEGYSPAGLRYMTRMGYDTRCFSADLLACAVDGAIGIHRDKRRLKDQWRLQKTGAGSAATAEQRTLLAGLFSGSETMLELDNANAATMQSAIRQHGKALATRFQPALFERNGGSIGLALAIAFLTAALALGFSGGSGIALIVLMLALMAIALVVFAIAIKAPTREGRRLMDEIAGLKRYLVVAEGDELARLGGPGAPPTLDAGRYERLLPYAVALDVEDAWTGKFTLAVGAAAAAAATSAIAWYHGSRSADMGSFAKAVGNSLSSQISSASTPPGSSSGGGGGGFSGGGGGGGGGSGR